MTEEERYEWVHEVEDPVALRGGTRPYPDGLRAFLTAILGAGEREERVTLFSKDRVGLAAALRRVADEVENISPFDLPRVEDACLYCTTLRNGADWGGEPFCSNECCKAAIDTHYRIYGRAPI